MVKGCEHRRHPCDGKPSSPDRYQNPNDRPYHLVAEGRCRYLEDQDVIDRTTPCSFLNPPDEHLGALAEWVLTPPAERGEVMLTDQVGARRIHRRHIECLCHVPGRRRQEGVRTGPVQDPVAICPTGCIEPGVKVILGRFDIRHDDRRRTQPVDRPAQLAKVDIIWNVEAENLASSVNSTVGTTGTGDDHLGPDDPGQDGLEVTSDGAYIPVDRKSVKRCPVVCDPCPNSHNYLAGLPEVATGGQTSSMRAIGALSPWRGPTLRIRV